MSNGQDIPQGPGSVEIPFDGLAQLCGGARAAHVLTGSSDTQPWISALDGPAAWLTPGTQAATPSAGTLRQLALEALSLKLRTFAAIVAQTPATATSVTPEQVRIRLLDGNGLLGAARWNVHVAVETGAGASGVGLRTSFGLLLARLLFATDGRNGDDAQQHGAELARTFASGSGSSPAENADRLFTNGPGSDSSAVLFSQDLRTQLRGKALPAGIWSQVGNLMLRLLTDVADFALPDQPRDELRLMLTSLRQRCDIATFGAIARRDEISALLRQNLARLQDDGA